VAVDVVVTSHLSD